jgi:single-stranded-DNA-specific exonuclease
LATSIRRRWNLHGVGSKAAGNLGPELGLSALATRILVARGIDAVDRGARFLTPDLQDLQDPWTMRDMPAAVDRLAQAKEARERVVVFGDYDVDGMTATACLTEFLTSAHIQCRAQSHSRDDPGHGLSRANVDAAHGWGARLIITADCGMGNADQINYARERGVDVLIVDHHQPPPVLPAACAILNPSRADCGFPFKGHSAVGVAFALVRAASETLGAEQPLQRYLDLVALGTIADAVSLLGDNRILTHFGLQELRRRRRPGINALVERALAGDRVASARAIAFRIAPRLNAAGRVGRADKCIELLLTTSYADALRLTEVLEQDNLERQREQKSMLAIAVPQAQACVDRGDHIIFVDGGEWPDALLGVVASRVKEQFQMPALVVAHRPEAGTVRMSLRAPAGIDLVDALTGMEPLVSSCGGHPAAAGLTAPIHNLEAIRQGVSERLRVQIARSQDISSLRVDAEISLGELDAKFRDDLERLGPFGTDNPEPILLARRVRPIRKRVVGAQHLRVQIAQGDVLLDTIGFAMADRSDEFHAQSLDILLTPRLTSWKGERKLELQIVDAQRSDDSGTTGAT